MAVIKIGTPVVGDIREGEIEHRYINGIGLVLYTKYRNQLYSSKMYPSSIPPLIDKKAKSIIKKSSFINIDQFTGELELDFDALTSASIANGDSILFIDATSSYAVRKESLADLSTLLAGTSSSTGLSASSSVLSVSDLHPVGVDGANNQLITDDGDGTVTSESGATYNGSTLAITGDITVSGGDITYGNGQNATASVSATAHNTAGKLLTISAGHTTAGTTNNIAGGSLKFEGGQGKGSGAGGNIVFATANAGSSGSSLNALVTALTISDDLSATFTGAILGTTIDATTDFTIDGLVITADTISNDADLTIDGAADIILSAAGYQIKMNDASTTRFTFNVDSTPEIDVTGAFTIDGSSTIRIDAVSNVDVYTNGREMLKLDTGGHVYINAFAQTLFNDYTITSKTANYHLTSGVADYEQNYSWVGKHFESSAYNTSYGS